MLTGELDSFVGKAPVICPPGFFIEATLAHFRSGCKALQELGGDRAGRHRNHGESDAFSEAPALASDFFAGGDVGCNAFNESGAGELGPFRITNNMR